MKTPEQIKAELNDALPVHFHRGDPEPRLTPFKHHALEALHAETLAYIQQLEAERDAAVNQLETISGCLACQHAETEPDEAPCNECIAANGEAVESRWQWRGVQKEETE